MAAYVVTAPLVQARKQDGTYVHVYEGGSLPDDVDEDQLKLLVDSGMVTSGPNTDDHSDDDGRPTHSAKKADWEDYATGLGIDIEGLSKEELIEAVEAAEG